MQAGPLLSLSPSFNSYSSTGKLAEIAARVVNEFRQESNGSNGGCVYDPWVNDGNLATQFEELSLNSNPREENLPQLDLDHNHEDEDEFEFASVCKDLGSSSPISADEIFYNGQIKPIYPLFNQDLLRNDAPRNVVVVGDRTSSMDSKTPPLTTKTTTRRRQPLRKLMIEEERETASMASTTSCSSSESDELDGLSPESFCVWTPKTTAESKTPGSCKKSNSTGSSKRWNFRQLLSRSNSEGKDMFVFLTPSKKSDKGISGDEKVAGKVTAKVVSVNGDGMGAHEAHYVKNRTVKEEDKKKSFLPYRQDLVGFFSNVNGLSRNLHPF